MLRRHSAPALALLVSFLAMGTTTCAFFLDTDELQKGQGAAGSADAGVDSSAGSGGGGGTGGTGGDGGTGTGGDGGTGTGGDGGTGTGGDAGTAGAGGSVLPEVACTEFGAAFCTELRTCAAFWEEVFFGDQHACNGRVKDLCLSGLKAQDAAGGAREVQECARNVIPQMECDDVFEPDPLGSCIPASGPRDVGAPCGVDSQCQSRYCYRQTNQHCGRCETRAQGGQLCRDDLKCEHGFACAPNERCVAWGKLNDSCSDNAPCLPTLACVGGECTERLIVEGEDCNVVDQACDWTQGLVCTGTCEQLPLSGDGGPCSLILAPPDPGLYFCNGLYACSEPLFDGTCVPRIEDGDACDGSTPCLYPAECIGGICQMPDPSNCNPP